MNLPDNYDCLWESDEPNPKICCICKIKFEKPFHVDRRPTGRLFKKQNWPFCKSCWEFDQAIMRGDTDAIDDILRARECEDSKSHSQSA